MESGLQKRLLADASVGSLVGTNIYPVVWPSDSPSFPLVIYQLISTVTSQVFSGTVTLATCRMQYDAWAKSYGAAKAVAAAIKNCLLDFQGILPDGTVVENITLDASADYFDSQTSTFRVQSDYMVTFHQS